jgi:N-acetylmuramoyl-L-alanine amidase
MIQSEVISELEPTNKRNIQPPGILRVLLKAETPAILIECGFISNEQDAKNMESNDFQDKLVAIIEKETEQFYAQN